MEIKIYRRSGFSPCCTKHMDYSPCECPKFAADFVVDGRALVTAFFDSEEDAKRIRGAKFHVPKRLVIHRPDGTPFRYADDYETEAFRSMREDPR